MSFFDLNFTNTSLKVITDRLADEICQKLLKAYSFLALLSITITRT